MFLSVKELSPEEEAICTRTLGPKAAFALIGDAIARKRGISVVRVADGELRLLTAQDGLPFTEFETKYPGWNKRYGIEGLAIEAAKKNILEAGNSCTFFAPSVSGISREDYKLYHLFEPREFYFDNFFVNDWTPEMIRMLLESSDGVFVIHRNYEEIINDFTRHYDIPPEHFSGFPKLSWQDNDAAVEAARASGRQLVLFSAGPAGKIIGPRIAAHGSVVLDVGNTLRGWSIGDPRSVVQQ